jgi:hypothetical protein
MRFRQGLDPEDRHPGGEGKGGVARLQVSEMAHLVDERRAAVAARLVVGAEHRMVEEELTPEPCFRSPIPSSDARKLLKSLVRKGGFVTTRFQGCLASACPRAIEPRIGCLDSALVSATSARTWSDHWRVAPTVTILPIYSRAAGAVGSPTRQGRQ